MQRSILAIMALFSLAVLGFGSVQAQNGSISPITQQQVDLLRSTLGLISGVQDRGQFYLELANIYHENGASDDSIEQILAQAQITTGGGAWGGGAILGNAYAQQQAGDRYDVTLDTFSWQIATRLLDAVQADINRTDGGGTGIFSIDEIQALDASVWNDKGIAHLFPGNIQLADYNDIPSDSVVYRYISDGNLVFWTSLDTILATLAIADIVLPHYSEMGQRFSDYGFSDNVESYGLTVGMEPIISPNGNYKLYKEEIGDFEYYTIKNSSTELTEVVIDTTAGFTVERIFNDLYQLPSWFSPASLQSDYAIPIVVEDPDTSDPLVLNISRFRAISPRDRDLILRTLGFKLADSAASRSGLEILYTGKPICSSEISCISDTLGNVVELQQNDASFSYFERYPITDIAISLGFADEEAFIAANPIGTLLYQTGEDGIEYVVYESEKQVTLPDGTKLDIGLALLLVQLGIDLTDDTLEIIDPDNVLGGIGQSSTDNITGDLLDLIFVIDTTGSMGDDIAEVQRRALEIINQVAASGSDWQIGIVTYRDHPQSPYGDPRDYVSRIESGFSSDQNSIISAINGITVGGGGDGPEAVYAGLMEAIGFPWRNGARKVLILMGDAPPHDPDPILGYTSETVLQAAYDVNPAQIFPILIASENAVRFPFQVLADGSSGRLFYADNAEEVVPTLLSTIDVATGIELSVGLEVQIASLEPSFPLRNSPSMLAGTVINLSRSEQATIIGGPEVVFEMSDRNVPQNFIWWQIRTESGSEGWMQETYYGEPILDPYSPDNPIAPVTCTLSTLGDINIRSGPGTNYQQIASRAGANQPLAANGQFGNISVVSEHWWQLIDGFWVRNDQVRENGDCASLPVVPAP